PRPCSAPRPMAARRRRCAGLCRCRTALPASCCRGWGLCVSSPQSAPGSNMGGYRRIVLAVDLTEETNIVAGRTQMLARAFDAELHLVHVIEPLSLAYGGDIPMDLSTVQDQIHEQAKSHLAEFAATLNVPAARQHLIFGRPESEIQRTAQAVNADVIVV